MLNDQDYEESMSEFNDELETIEIDDDDLELFVIEIGINNSSFSSGGRRLKKLQIHLR